MHKHRREGRMGPITLSLAFMSFVKPTTSRCPCVCNVKFNLRLVKWSIFTANHSILLLNHYIVHTTYRWPIRRVGGSLSSLMFLSGNSTQTSFPVQTAEYWGGRHSNWWVSIVLKQSSTRGWNTIMEIWVLWKCTKPRFFFSFGYWWPQWAESKFLCCMTSPRSLST